jgi:hypothetical protein
MLKGYEKLQILDTSEKATGMTVEVNWNDEPEITDCKILKITFPDGKVSFVKKGMFLGFLWAIGSTEEHQKMIPQTLTKVRWYETVVSVRVKKDIKAGENLTFPIKITLPKIEEEALGEIKQSVAKKHGIILPT